MSQKIPFWVVMTTGFSRSIIIIGPIRLVARQEVDEQELAIFISPFRWGVGSGSLGPSRARVSS
jgi:hypothetical protein